MPRSVLFMGLNIDFDVFSRVFRLIFILEGSNSLKIDVTTEN